MVDIINIPDGDIHWGDKMRTNLANLSDEVDEANLTAARALEEATGGGAAVDQVARDAASAAQQTADSKYSKPTTGIPATDVVPVGHAYVTTVPYLAPDGSYEYEVTTVHAPGGGLNRTVEKVYGANYEKTWTPGTTFNPPTQPFASYQALGGGYVVISSDAFQGGQMAGLQIKKGVLYRGWGNYSNDPRVGQEAIALMKDGTWKVFTVSTNPNPATLVAAGVDTTWGFGPLVVINGAVRGDLGDASKWGDWVTSLSGRHLLGYNANGDMVSIIVKGKTGSAGIAGVEMGNVALRHGCVNAIMLDGGGSVQARSSYLFHPSTDTGGNRDVNNAIVIKTALAAPIRWDWDTQTYQNGFTTGTANAPLVVSKTNGRVRMRGTAALSSIAANTWYTVATIPERYRLDGSWGSYRCPVYTNNGGYAGVVSVGSDGTIQVKSPVAVASGTFWEFDNVEYDAAY